MPVCLLLYSRCALIFILNFPFAYHCRFRFWFQFQFQCRFLFRCRCRCRFSTKLFLAEILSDDPQKRFQCSVWNKPEKTKASGEKHQTSTNKSKQADGIEFLFVHRHIHQYICGVSSGFIFLHFHNTYVNKIRIYSWYKYKYVVPINVI